MEICGCQIQRSRGLKTRSFYRHILMDYHAVFVCVVATFGSILVTMEVCESCCWSYGHRDYDDMSDEE